MNVPGHALGSTPKGEPFDKARPMSITCFTHLEFHYCSECGELIAHCIVHDEGINCRSCGVSM